MAETVLDHLSASNMFDLRGVVAVITGGGTGIGFMISSTLVANGARVYMIGPKQEDLDRLANKYNNAAEKTNRPGRMYGLEGDIRRTLAGSALPPAAPTAAAFRAAYFDVVSQDDFDMVLNTNAVGPYWMTFAFLPLLEKWKENTEGARLFIPQIIITSSMNGWTKDPATSSSSFPYMYSKSAIGHATASLAHELLPLSIRVNGIAPGLFATEMTAPGTQDAVGQSHFPPGKYSTFSVPTSQPGNQGGLGGTNRDVGSLVLFLVSNWFVNGETVLIDGGTLLKHPSSY